MTIKVYRKGKEVEVYKEVKSTETIDDENVNIINETEEEIREFEEEMKAQVELERMKLEEPEKYIELQKKNKRERNKGILFLIWFFGSISLMLTFAGIGKVPLMLSVFGHYFAVFGLIAYVNNNDKEPLAKIIPLIFMLFGLTFMIGCILYQFEIIKF